MDWSLRWIIPESDLDERERSSLVRSSFDEFAKQREKITMMRVPSEIGERLRCETMIREGFCDWDEEEKKEDTEMNEEGVWNLEKTFGKFHSSPSKIRHNSRFTLFCQFILLKKLYI